MFTVYLIKVVWGGDAPICACINLMLLLRKHIIETLQVIKLYFLDVCEEA
jgi:hypothetical protein